MIKHQAFNSVLPAQVEQPEHLLATPTTTIPSMLAQQQPTDSSLPMLITPQTPQTQRRQQQQLQSHNSINRLTSKFVSRRHHLQHNNRRQHHLIHQYHLNQQHKPKVIRASEYKNLRQVVPSLRRQRDVGKVEVVTEAARYIDHLHKTLIERFVLCGIPDSLKGKLLTTSQSVSPSAI